MTYAARGSSPVCCTVRVQLSAISVFLPQLQLALIASWTHLLSCLWQNITMMHWLAFWRLCRRWRRFVISLVCLPVCIGLIVIIPELIGPLLLLILALLTWERFRMTRAMRNLARRIQSGDHDTKLEVQDDAWGSLCHAVNNLLQQQRLHQHTRAFRPSLPSGGIQTLLDRQFPAQGIPCACTILVVGACRISPKHTQGLHEHLEHMARLSTIIQQQTEQHNVLLEHCGELLLLAFGTFDDNSLTTSLRSALQVAHRLRQVWEAGTSTHTLTLSLTSGIGLATILPGLGYTVFGEPVEQALRLAYLAADRPEYTLLCSEEVHLTLRRIDATPWLPTDLRLLYPDRPPQIIYALASEYIQSTSSLHM